MHVSNSRDLTALKRTCRKLEFMANAKQPTSDQVPALEELHEAAVLRNLAYSFYLRAFTRALRAGVGPSLIARYARISPQAANSTKNRLASVPPEDDAPTSIDDVLNRLKKDPPPTFPKRREA